MPVQPTIAFHTISFSHAFWNAVPMNRGGSHSSACIAKPTSTTPNPKPQWTTAPTLASWSLRTCSVTSWAVCGIASSADDPQSLALARPAELLHVRLADERLLDEHADVGRGPAWR